MTVTGFCGQRTRESPLLRKDQHTKLLQTSRERSDVKGSDKSSHQVRFENHRLGETGRSTALLCGALTPRNTRGMAKPGKDGDLPVPTQLVPQRWACGPSS